MPTIQLENVSKWFWAGRKRRKRRKEFAISEVSLTVRQGEFLFVIGSTGSGKSTLLNLISGKLKPASGQVLVDGADLHRMQLFHRREARLLFGTVAREGNLDHRLTVEENLLAEARRGRRRGELPEELQARVRKAMGLVGMARSGQRHPAEMSRGDYRRIELARALVNSPPILVLDELTANLDDDSIWDMLHLLRELNRAGTTVIMATHSSKYVNLLRQRVITMVDGQVGGDVEKGRYGVVR